MNTCCCSETGGRAQTEQHDPWPLNSNRCAGCINMQKKKQSNLNKNPSPWRSRQSYSTVRLAASSYSAALPISRNLSKKFVQSWLERVITTEKDSQLVPHAASAHRQRKEVINNVRSFWFGRRKSGPPHMLPLGLIKKSPLSFVCRG